MCFEGLVVDEGKGLVGRRWRSGWGVWGRVGWSDIFG